MSLYPFGTIDLADRRREPAVSKGQIVRILLTFLACALAFTLAARTSRAAEPVTVVASPFAG